MRLPASPLVAAKPDHRAAQPLENQHPWLAAVSCCHARSALLRRGILPAARPLLPHGRPSRRGRADALPRAGGLARVVTDPERSPLLGRGLRGPPAPAGRDQRPYRLASRWIVPAGAQVEVHPAALPLHLIDLAFAVVLATGLEGEQLCVPRERLECYQHVSHCHALRVATSARSVDEATQAWHGHFAGHSTRQYSAPQGRTRWTPHPT
jgi:hypothetical protein